MFLIRQNQRVHHAVQITVQDALQIAQRQGDAVIRHTVLRKIVGPDFFTAVAGAHLALSPGVVFPVISLLLLLQKAAAQNFEGAVLVLPLAALVLAFHHHAGGQVVYTDGG